MLEEEATGVGVVVPLLPLLAAPAQPVPPAWPTPDISPSPNAAAAAAVAAASSGLRLPHAALARAARPASSGMLNSAPATWGLGFQLGRVVDASGRSLPLVGHLGLGGVAGLAVPAAGVALAVTVSQLSVRCAPTRRLVELLLRECGLRLEPGFLPEDD